MLSADPKPVVLDIVHINECEDISTTDGWSLINLQDAPEVYTLNRNEVPNIDPLSTSSGTVTC